jgi:hypothetical protein
MGTMTVFVRLHYSYKPVVNSGDVGHTDDSILRLYYSYKLVVKSSDVGHNDDSICKITLLI